MFVEVITPDKQIFSGEATSVRFPGADGSFEVLNNHAPMISALAAGTVYIRNAGKEEQIHIGGGLTEVLKNKVTVLAESVQL
ncbi:MAG: ATP synthase F1 subunit epsilon [Bacteroidota bacterium]